MISKVITSPNTTSNYCTVVLTVFNANLTSFAMLSNDNLMMVLLNVFFAMETTVLLMSSSRKDAWVK